jgi:geranylgeranyl pyrophosphate synthase
VQILDIAWNWCALQLDDGTDVTLYQLQDLGSGKDAGSMAVVIPPYGKPSYAREFTMTPTRWWTSMRTFEHYPVTWSVKVPSLGVDLSLEATVDDQEFITVTSKPSFWEGQCKVTGSLEGKSTRGMGYIERSGHTNNESLDDFFKAVSVEVRKSVAFVLPLHPTREEAVTLFATEKHAHLLEGLDEQEIASTLVAPIRTITDRGGKAWRSYAALACAEALGADSRKHIKWLSLPEIMHSGSLIVDDVEDRSVVRRGGPTAHVIYGEALAINAGTAAYFLAEGTLANENEISDKKTLRLIRLYFEGLRAGHAGQALDIHGFDELVDEVVVSGDSGLLEKRITGMFRLKTGAPAGVLARMGVVAADGTPEQEEALGRFFENLGLSFQMVDDVLNLRGFHGKLKNVGEDITSGKFTLPVAIGLGRLGQPEREWLVQTIRSKPEDPTVVRDVIHLLVKTGALDECLRRADDLVEESWKKVSPLLPESLHKVMLRAFCWYVLERHY